MPYSILPKKSYWKHCLTAEDFALFDMFKPKFAIRPSMNIATAGSCFAQKVGRYLRDSSANFLDVELSPPGLTMPNKERFGYGLYSGRYGNIYSARQLLQLVSSVYDRIIPTNITWKKNDRFYDALRPSVEPNGLSSAEEVFAQRLDHLQRLRKLFGRTDVFIFTLGLTEMWSDKKTDVVFPSCPGVIAGVFDVDRHHFENANYRQVYVDLSAAISMLRTFNPSMKFILTVSPIPLTATATAKHVLPATIYSKSTLRAVAGDLAAENDFVDYFPSYEIITGAPFSGRFFKADIRQVTDEGVIFVMSLFSAAYEIFFRGQKMTREKKVEQRLVASDIYVSREQEVCEDILLEAFFR